MDGWLREHGTPSLQRAHKEGYEVKKGIADLLIDGLAQDAGMRICKRWDEAGVRTSPRAEAFAKRDLVVDYVGDSEVPPGWHFDVSRIQRVTVEGKHFTGVIVAIRDDERRHIKEVAFNFE